MGFFDSLFGGAPKRSSGLTSKIRKLKKLGYHVKRLKIRGIKVLRVELPKNVRLTKKHPFRSAQYPIEPTPYSRGACAELRAHGL